MQYAIIRAGGHQEKVTVGERIVVDRLKDEVGAEVSFVPLLVSQEDGSVLSKKGDLGSAKVTGTVLEHTKGDKVEVGQYRNKTNYRRRTGFRSSLTVVEITGISV
jgi:large subunit ribosomal protein L21